MRETEMPTLPPSKPKPNGKGVYIPPRKVKQDIGKQRESFIKKIKRIIRKGR